MTKTARSCGKPGHRSHHTQGLGITAFLMAWGLEHRKTCVLEGSSMAVGGEGGALWEPDKQRSGRQSKVLLSFSYFSGRWVGAGP